jgi:hypothetical protein
VNTLWAGCAAVLVFAAVSGCARRHPEPMPPLGPTLQIVNQSSLVYRVTVSPVIVVVVHPGQTTCIRVGMLHGERTIEFFALASRVTHYTPHQNLMSESGWIVEIGELPRYDVLSLRPADPCKPSLNVHEDGGSRSSLRR